MSSVTINTDTGVVTDPNAGKPNDNIVVNGNVATVDPTKPAGTPADATKLILGKFKDQAALEAAYVEAEKKLTAQATKTTTSAQSQETITKAGFDLKVLAQEVVEKGALTPESLKALAEKGLSAAVVTDYVAGLQAQAQAVRTELAAVAGGEKQFVAVQQWAATNLTAAEIAAYNNALDASDTATAKLVFSAIAARHAAAVGIDPQLINSDIVPGSSGAKPFGSTAEMVEAMKDRRYANDPAYRDAVARRVAVSNTFGNPGTKAGVHDSYRSAQLT